MLFPPNLLLEGTHFIAALEGFIFLICKMVIKIHSSHNNGSPICIHMGKCIQMFFFFICKIMFLLYYNCCHYNFFSTILQENIVRAKNRVSLIRLLRVGPWLYFS